MSKLIPSLHRTAPLVVALAVTACNPSGTSDVVVGGGPPLPTGGLCEASVRLAGSNGIDAGQVHLAADDLNEADRVALGRAVVVTAPTGAELTVEGPFALVDATGAPIEGPVLGEDVVVYLTAEDLGTGTLTTVLADGCDAAAIDPIALEAVQPPAIVGHGLPVGSAFDFVRLFNVDEAVEAQWVGALHGDRAGLTGTAHVVPHRTPSDYLTEPALDNAFASVAGIAVDGSIQLLWDTLAVPDDAITSAFDVVLDLDDDGAFSPGDQLYSGIHGAFTVVRDLTDAGPYGTEAFEHSPSYWNTMRIYMPTDASAPQPAPVVVISHGNGHDYTWYDYLGEHFASWGYVVLSHRNDTVPGVYTAAATTLSNTETFLRDANSLGLTVDIDRNNISWIGHSRGGEGIVIAYNDLHLGSAGVSEFDVDDVVLLQSIAPTAFEDPTVTHPRQVPFHILSGGADGDVTGGPESEVTQYYRMFQRGKGPHFVTYVHGADHNDFNCCGADDGTWFTVVGDPPLIGRTRAQNVGKSYLLALTEAVQRGNQPLAEYLSRSPEQFRPISANAYIATQWMPGTNDRYVIDDFQSENAVEVASSGSTVTFTTDVLVEGPLDDPDGQLSHQNSQPSNGMTWSEGDASPERGAILEWASGTTGEVRWEVTEGDWRPYEALSIRAAQQTRHPNTVALDDLVSLSIELRDAGGQTAVIATEALSRLPELYPRGGLGSGTGWANEFQTIRIELDEFRSAAPDLNLAEIRSVAILVGGTLGSDQGRLGLDDVELVPGGAL